MSIAKHIKEYTDNNEKYIATMATLPDKELAKKLDWVYIQTEHAENNKNTASLELLDVWHRQLIEARIHKVENNISDTPHETELKIDILLPF